MSEVQFSVYLAYTFIGIILGYIIAPLAVTLGYALSDAVSGRIAARIESRARMKFESKMAADRLARESRAAATAAYYDEMMGGAYRTNVGRGPHA